MKKKILKGLLYLAGFVVIAVVLLLVYVKTMLPNVGDAPDLKVEITPERVAHGKYLANHVMGCNDCHGQRDYSVFSAPMIPGSEGHGGEVFDQTMVLPGRYVAPNITPTHLGDWTDGEIFRAITTGVSKDGHALFPLMPYQSFRQLDKEDILSVIAYIRTLKPIDFSTDKSSSDFPMNFIINTIPVRADLKPAPDRSDTVAYGKYLVTAASCNDCHTRQEKGEFVGKYLAGGFEFKFPDGSVLRSANITPDKNTGIGAWTEVQFVDRFKEYSDSSFVPVKVGQGDFQTLMPWTFFAGMKTDDLKAIYAYLRTIEPVNNEVIHFTPPQ